MEGIKTRKAKEVAIKSRVDGKRLEINAKGELLNPYLFIFGF